MAFNDKEISNQDGRAISLYMMRWGFTIWRYTSADRPITRHEGDLDVTYLPVPIKHSNVVQGSSSQSDFTVDCPSSLPVCELFRGTPPVESVWLTMRQMHYGETDAPIQWLGTITNIKHAGDPGAAQIIGRPLSSSFKRTGLRLCWTKECPHFLYDSDCSVALADFQHITTITAVTPIGFTVADVGGHPDGYYHGGLIRWEANSDHTIESRMIESQTGVDFLTFGLTDRLEVGMSVKLHPGCDRTPITCKTKFNNIDNFGGFDFMPGKSPFGTNLF